MSDYLSKLLAKAFEKKADEIRQQVSSSEVGKAKNDTSVRAFTPQDRLRLRVADTAEDIAKDLQK